MKIFKTFLSILCVAALLLASCLSAAAIGFNAEDTYASVFVVTSGGALGSGFAVGQNCIVTNAHVVDNPESILLTTYSGEQYAAYLIGQDAQKDIAVLGVNDATFTPLKTADAAALNTGDDVYAIGAPKSMAYTLTKGVISAKERKVGEYTYIQTDAAINEGNSGGPLVNDAGNVVGVNTLKMTDSEGIGLAIPMSEVNAYLRSLNIELNADGTAAGAVSAPDGTTPPENAPAQDAPEQETPKKPSRTEVQKVYPWQYIALWVALGVSLAINILLLILWIFQRKKNLRPAYDPRERTDFEIDILE